MNDVQEELMDAVLYIQAAKEEIQDMSEDGLLLFFAEEACTNVEDVFERCPSHEKDK